MSDKAIEYLVEYPLYYNDLKELTEDQIAALAIVGYAVSETNMLRKLYLFSRHDFVGDSAIDAAIAMQQFVVLRTWSAKLFEFSEFLSFGGKKKSTSDPKLLELADDALVCFSSLKDMTGYNLAKHVRHEASNHYSFEAARKNLPFLSKSANFNLYLHEMQGNSFFPIGEELMFVARMGRYGANMKTKEEKIKLLDEWMDWNIQATEWLDSVHTNFAEKLIIERLPDRIGRKRTYWVQPDLVGKPEERKVPIFFRKEATW